MFPHKGRDPVLCRVCSSRTICYTTGKLFASEVGEVVRVLHQPEGTRLFVQYYSKSSLKSPVRTCRDFTPLSKEVST
ncbi:hypothetical protein MTR67_024310 [Solanum verrucosum]|uniref:Uncharacterized protein n=1 Tax=Solanum verrucosum TaxID=315347 RepID=A0AAF0TYD2_SOLVR|nr:hypothetical protein MTR67_024310 [Solanum verrucosum]